jgi:hypothetical protein
VAEIPAARLLYRNGHDGRPSLAARERTAWGLMAWPRSGEQVAGSSPRPLASTVPCSHLPRRRSITRHGGEQSAWVIIPSGESNYGWGAAPPGQRDARPREPCRPICAKRLSSSGSRCRVCCHRLANKRGGHRPPVASPRPDRSVPTAP